MKRRISRWQNRVSLIFVLAFGAFFIMGRIFKDERFMIVALIMFIVGFCFMVSSNRCPNCGRFFMGHYWSEPDAGPCKRCGELLEFDDIDKKKKKK